MEGFHPGGSRFYRRVLVPIQDNGTMLLAWLYEAYTGLEKLAPMVREIG
jgi:hypothetical protein